jgi:activating signal cointegrator complex subunit 3
MALLAARKRRAASSAGASVSHTSSDLDAAAELSWEALTATLPGSAQFNVPLKSAYAEFIAAMRPWASSDDNGPGFLLSAAAHVFTALTTTTPGSAGAATPAAARPSFERLLGRCPSDRLYADVCAAALALSRVRDAVATAAEADAATAVAGAGYASAATHGPIRLAPGQTHRSGLMSLEFGQNLPYNDPIQSHFAALALEAAATQPPHKDGAAKPLVFQRASASSASASARGAVPIASAALAAMPDKFFYVDPADAEDDTEAAAAAAEAEAAATAAAAAEPPAPALVAGSYPWLLHECGPHATYTDSGEPLVTAPALAQSVLAILGSARADSQVEDELCDLCGYGALDLVSLLLSHRAQLRKVSKADVAAATAAAAAASAAEARTAVAAALGGTLGGRQARMGAGLTVVSLAAKAAAKEAGRLERRFLRLSEPAAVHARGALGTEWEDSATGETAADRARAKERARRAANEAVLRSLDAFRGDAASLPGGGMGMATALPDGTTRTVNERGWETVHVPPPTLDALPEEQRVPLEAFSSLVRPALRGVKRLNALQSRVYPCAYKSNENMLVCAPTGAGKTNVAMMTVLREVENNCLPYAPGEEEFKGKGAYAFTSEADTRRIQKRDFKIVYVAPMKALASEVTAKFSSALAPLGLVVKELTGDTQLTKAELAATQMIVTTPEKWDVLTRKAGDGSLLQQVGLLIIDEVHLLHEERGPVLEILVARTQRHVETSQKLCRIVGLSATLPNYRDVGVFLGVNERTGLFHFDGRYRPVPLDQYYIGVSAPTQILRVQQMNEVTYEKSVESLAQGNQVMVFVFSRNETVKVADFLYNASVERGTFETHFSNAAVPTRSDMLRRAATAATTPGIGTLLSRGFGIHHAGMTRAERGLVEQAFMKGELSVLVCTSTLAWGVNLPAHTVILRGTQIYDPKRGGHTDVGMLDVAQIFGRAGRPQFDSSGEAFLVTTKDKLPHYLRLLVAAAPIESQLVSSLPDHLNAEITLGTVTNLREAEVWLTYTYLYVRLLRNPTAYGVALEDIQNDPSLVLHRRTLLLNAAKELMQCRMIKFDFQSGQFFGTDVGRVASLYYIHHKSVDTYNHLLQPYMTDEQLLDLVAHSREFAQLQVRNEEAPVLLDLKAKGCPFPVLGDPTSFVAKANILLQCYISGTPITSATLVADSYYVQQSAGRIVRALFEMVLRRGRSYLAAKLLELCKVIDRRLWPMQHPLRQFPHVRLNFAKLEAQKLWLDELSEMDARDLDDLLNSADGRAGAKVKSLVRQIPWLDVRASAQPLTRDVLRITLRIHCDFDWREAVHGHAEHWWIWVEDTDNEQLYHHELFTLERTRASEEHVLHLTIPIYEPLPSQYVVRVISDRWLGSDLVLPLSFKSLLLPEQHPPHTDLLKLNPLPVTALQDPAAESLFQHKFTHFNPIQTQAFHTLYHSDANVLLGAPTGSGKTIVAELAILRALRMYPGRKVVYIAPMKALARERMDDWGSARSLSSPRLGCRVVELTGDVAPDPDELRRADVLVTTPEKWDGVSRNWRAREYVQSVSLIVIDEIHLLGQDRGPVLEVIVSRMRYVAAQTAATVRILGLSTALANARDLADWLGIDARGLFNFHPVMRPVPLTIYVSGFPGRFYCPRMATMNKPTYAAICAHSPSKPTLVFVSSRRQTRLTGLDLVAFAAADGLPRRFLKIEDDDELEYTLAKVKDSSLKHLLSFGVGLHHAGLPASDRSLVEELFVRQRILVLICTATLAWGVNLPAHLVVVKGTEYFDAKLGRYVDFPITDVLQMMGRAGRPQYDTEGKACILVHEPKKPFYHKFLHSPFPVESSLHEQLGPHLNAEIASGAITSEADAVDWLSWTFYFRRLLLNPAYYGLEDPSPAGARAHLLRLIRVTLRELEQANCVVLSAPPSSAGAKNKGAGSSGDDGELLVEPTSLGAIAAYYYIHHKTIATFCSRLAPTTTLEGLLAAVCHAQEYAEMPVRHNEDVMNLELIKQLQDWPQEPAHAGEPACKTNLLFQARWSGLPLPISDYLTDTKTALDQSARLLHALVDITADAGWLRCTLRATTLMQSITQGQWAWAPPLASVAVAAGLPSWGLARVTAAFARAGCGDALPALFALPASKVAATVYAALTNPAPRRADAGAGADSGVGAGGRKRGGKSTEEPSACSETGAESDLDARRTMAAHEAERAAAAFAATIACLPRVDVRIDPSADWSAGSGAQAPAAAAAPVRVSGSEVRVGLCRTNAWAPVPGATPAARAAALAALRTQEPAKVMGPRDVKAKKEGWWVIVGREDADELAAVKRVTVSLRRQVVALDLGEDAPRGRYTVYIVSDCYLGLDQQYDFELA